MVKVVAVRSQLKQICSQLNLSFKHTQDSDAIRYSPSLLFNQSMSVSFPRLCILHGFFMNVAEHVQDGRYQTVSCYKVIHCVIKCYLL